MTENRPIARYAIWALVILLIILHQDIWFWQSDRIVLGFMPIGLFYHVCISIAASITWYLATKFAWPHELESIDPVGASANREHPKASSADGGSVTPGGAAR